MGLLDQKTRIFDVVLTQEGKKQLSNGTLRLKYASLSDRTVAYDNTLVSGALDPLISFEAFSSPNDSIALETYDGGRIITSGSVSYQLVNERIVSSELVNGITTTLTSDTFSSVSSEMLSASFDNLKSLRIISTKDIFTEDLDFTLDKEKHTFELTNRTPIDKRYEISSTTIDRVESLIHDTKLTRAWNFMYLPPVNKSRSLLGDYARLNRAEEISYDEIDALSKKRPSFSFKFKETSNENNLVFQIFEKTDDTLKKLDVIDYGEVNFDDNIKRVFFVGKLFKDGFDNDTFINMFTMVFEK